MIINKLLNKISVSFREIYYNFFPDYDFIFKLENGLVFGLTIETCNICNANCVFCPYQYQTRKKLLMSKAMFNKIIDDYNNIGGGNLGIGGSVGDPLLDPYLLDRINYARQFSNIKNIDIVTNCINLQKIGAKNLLTSGLNIISISTSGFDLKVYEQIYRSNKANVMKNNIIELLKTNKELGEPCKIKLELRTFQPMKKVINNPEFKHIVGLAESINQNYFFDDWSGRIRQDNLPKGMKIRPRISTSLKKVIPCFMLYGRMSIFNNGKASLCPCQDLNADSELIVGNIEDNSLLRIYTSDNVVKLREQWRKHRKIPKICKDCVHYNPFTYLMLEELKINAAS